MRNNYYFTISKLQKNKQKNKKNLVAEATYKFKY